MNQLLEIQPSRELKFLFEVNKQSICNVQLINKTDQHVAFNIKITSPKKYFVRPNVGVVLPNEACEFAVIMLAQRSPPSDMNCKDKFMVQSTIVPEGTMENDITFATFSKEDGKYIEERKLKVVILIPPHSPELSPMNRKVKQVPPVEGSVLADELLNRRERHSQHEVVKTTTPWKYDCAWPNGSVDEQSRRSTWLTYLSSSDTDEEDATEADASWDAAVAEPELILDTKPAFKREADFHPIEVLKSNTVDKLEAKSVITKNLESRPTELVEPNTVEENSVIMRDVESQSIEIMESDSVDNFGEKPVIVRDVESQPIQIVKSNSVDKLESKPVIRNDVQSQPTEVVKSNTVEKLTKDVEEIMSKLLLFQSELSKAEKTIVKLTEVLKSNTVDKLESEPVIRKDVQSRPTEVVESNTVEKLAKDVEEIKSKQLQLESELSKALLKDQRIQITLHVPLLSVCMVAMLSILIGYLLHR